MEKTFTRNWQTLPYSIAYARLPLTGRKDKIELQFTGAEGVKDSPSADIPAIRKGTRFLVYPAP